MSRKSWSIIGAVFALAAGGGGAYALRKAPVAPVEAPVAAVEAEPVVAPVVVPAVTTAAEYPSWEGIAVTVVCSTAVSDASLRAACPDYFTADWKTAAERDGYTSGSQKLAKVDCGMAHLDALDEITRGSLTCRDSLNAAIYGQDGSGGGACAAEIASFCKGEHPTPGANPTDACLEAVVTDGDPATVLSPACASAVANHRYAEDAQRAR